MFARQSKHILEIQNKYKYSSVIFSDCNITEQTKTQLGIFTFCSDSLSYLIIFILF